MHPAAHVRRRLPKEKQHERRKEKGKREKDGRRGKKGGIMKEGEEQEGAVRLHEIKNNLSPPLAISITFTTLIRDHPRPSLILTNAH